VPGAARHKADVGSQSADPIKFAFRRVACFGSASGLIRPIDLASWLGSQGSGDQFDWFARYDKHPQTIVFLRRPKGPRQCRYFPFALRFLFSEAPSRIAFLRIRFLVNNPATIKLTHHRESSNQQIRRVSFPLRLLPRLPCDKACSICRIGRIPLSLFLAGKMSHRKAVSFDRPPTFRRPMRPGLDRHHLIGFVGIVVGHFSFVFGLRFTRLSDIRSM
jgi:hypothetical protein